MDKLLIEDFGTVGRKQRIYALYQQGLSDGEIADHLRAEYNRHGIVAEERNHEGPCVLADGGAGYGYFVAAEWRLRRRDVDGPMRCVKYEEMAQHIRALIDAGRYLTPEELEQAAPTQNVPTPESEISAPVHVPGAAIPIPAPTPKREITQADIDAALREWNGDMDSKRRVQRHMTDHARDRGTAEWLKNEYGENFPAYPIHGEGTGTDLPWTKVQRHLARLVREDRFFTEAEQENFEDIDANAVREHLKQYADKPSPFVEQVMADVERVAGESAETSPDQAPTIREIFEQYKPIVKSMVLADAAYQNACKNSDKENAIIEGDAAVKRAALTVQDAPFMRLYHDMADFRYRLHREVVDETYSLLSQPQQEHAAPPNLSDQSITRDGDAAAIEDGDTAQEVKIAVSGEEGQVLQQTAPEKPARDPMTPAYQVGDTVYLENTAYEIDSINLFDVMLRDPAMPIPILRSEPVDWLELLVRRDARNGHITEFLGTDLEKCDADMREVLTSHLLTERDKGYIIGWLRSGETNTRIAQRLSELFSGNAETVMLETGEHADYFTTTLGMSFFIAAIRRSQ